MLDAHFSKSTILWHKSMYKEFLKSFLIGLNIAIKKGDTEFQCRFLGNVGLGYYYLSDSIHARQYCNEALDLARKIGDKTEEMRNLGYLAMIHRVISRHHDAKAFLPYF